ncbi:Hypothetical protein SMAX5B_000104 [Scophthalmus maximus]|uniref:Uncharacterized protein n=1 Tax=Scophthalmus maximus TaxID=52904 RepID=A0A2U9CWE5_SCOMX|nr:Hypothetical protein SMAX5B_000104 [Scophthalmus maximus]
MAVWFVCDGSLIEIPVRSPVDRCAVAPQGATCGNFHRNPPPCSGESQKSTSGDENDKGTRTLTQLGSVVGLIHAPPAPPRAKALIGDGRPERTRRMEPLAPTASSFTYSSQELDLIFPFSALSHGCEGACSDSGSHH